MLLFAIFVRIGDFSETPAPIPSKNWVMWSKKKYELHEAKVYRRMLPKNFTLYACFHFTLVLIHINTTILLLIIPNTDFILASKCKVGNLCRVKFVVLFTSYWQFWYFGCDFQGKYCDSGVVPHFVFINSTCQYKYCWISWISENYQTSYSGLRFFLFLKDHKCVFVKMIL